jgi:hypothetical protein
LPAIPTQSKEFMDAYPPNSGRAAKAQPAASAEPRHVEQVTQSEARVKRAPLGRKFRDTFISGDAKTTVGYVFASVVMPQIKDLMVDSVTQGFERLVYGESRGGRRPMGPGGHQVFGGAPGKINYGAVSNQAPPPRGRQISPMARQHHDFGEIQVSSHAEAQNVLEALYTLYGQYDYVTVADLYSLVGIAANHVDRKWGWTDLRGAHARRTRSGAYILDLPRPESLGE